MDDKIKGLVIETIQTHRTMLDEMVECGVEHRVREEGKSKLKVIKTSMDFLRFLFYLRGKINLYRRGILARL